MKKQKTRAFTLIEMMVSIAVLAIITLAIYALIEAGSTSYNQTSRLNTLQQNGRRVLDELSEELRIANPAPGAFTISTETGGSRIQFQRVMEKHRDGKDGYDTSTGTVNYTDPIQYYVENSPADVNNNGIVDEFRLMRKDLGTGKVSMISDYLQTGGFTVTREPTDLNQPVTSLVLTLKLMVADSKQKLIQKTVTTKVTIRNRAI